MPHTTLQNRAAIVQRELDKTVRFHRPESARTLATFQEGTRTKQGRLAGYQTSYWRDHAHGQSLISPLAGSYSFQNGLPQETGAMYIGLAFRNWNFPLEYTTQQDMKRGAIPDSYLKERARRTRTHLMKKNWAAIGDGSGSIAAVSSCVTNTLTCLANNSARGTSKGVFRLKVSKASAPLLYDCIDPATDTLKATFYVTAKPTTTTATVVFTVGNAAAMNVNTYKICESGQWKMEMNGIAGLISDSTSRIFQGADAAVDDFLRNPSIDAGNAVLTPTMIHSAKSVMITRGDRKAGEDFGYIGHITPTNFRDLAKFGYTSRTYNAEKGQANTTHGLPTAYEDGDTMWVDDRAYEDCYVDLRPKNEYFEYVHTRLALFDDGSGSRKQWPGAYAAGSVLSYENYFEVCNLAWDGGGADGSGPEGGSPSMAVTIKNIAMNTTTSEYAVGN